MVTFAAPAGGGVAATGVASIDANGTVTAVTITSPGSGYGNDEHVAVTFNRGNNMSGAAVGAAAAFNTGADLLNASGGLAKVGAGELTLSSSNNSYSGPTNVSAGTLNVTGALLGNTAVTVAGGATLSGAGSIAGTVGVAGGASSANQGTISLVDGAIGTLTLNNTGSSTTVLTLGGSPALPAVLDFELGTSVGCSDQIAITNGMLAVNGGIINITPLGTVVPGTYNLITTNSAGQVSGLSNFTLATTSSTLGGYAASLQSSGGTEQLIIAAPYVPPTAYWQGLSGVGPAWSTVGNWTCDAPGNTPLPQMPAGTTNLYFATTGGTATVDQNFAVNSVSFTSSNSVTINGTGTLTLNGSAGLS